MRRGQSFESELKTFKLRGNSCGSRDVGKAWKFAGYEKRILHGEHRMWKGDLETSRAISCSSTMPVNVRSLFYFCGSHARVLMKGVTQFN